jgi:predicted HicB family RNase H-like nuclease
MATSKYGIKGIKRIIGGKAYNTDTSALVHEVFDEINLSWYDALYQTKHGAFFTYSIDQERDAVGVKPLSDDEAQKWLEDREVDAAVIEQYFGAFPEGGAAESRITLRLPGNLYHRVSASAETANLSLNTYIMRLIERSESHAADGGKARGGEGSPA